MTGTGKQNITSKHHTTLLVALIHRHAQASPEAGATGPSQHANRCAIRQEIAPTKTHTQLSQSAIHKYIFIYKSTILYYPFTDIIYIHHLCDQRGEAKSVAEAGQDLRALEFQQMREWEHVEPGQGRAARAAEEAGTVTSACLRAGIEGGKSGVKAEQATCRANAPCAFVIWSRLSGPISQSSGGHRLPALSCRDSGGGGACCWGMQRAGVAVAPLHVSGAATTSWQLYPHTPSPHANSVSTTHYRPLDGTPTGRDLRPTLASDTSRSTPIPATYACTNQRTRAHNHTAYRPPSRGVAPGPPYTPQSLDCHRCKTC
jgi:hypothetical protein